MASVNLKIDPAALALLQRDLRRMTRSMLRSAFFRNPLLSKPARGTALMFTPDELDTLHTALHSWHLRLIHDRRVKGLDTKDNQLRMARRLRDRVLRAVRKKNGWRKT